MNKLKFFLFFLSLIFCFLFRADKISAAPNYDLAVQSISVNPSAPWVNKEAVVTVVVVNLGTDNIYPTNSLNDISYNFGAYQLLSEDYSKPAEGLGSGQSMIYKFRVLFTGHKEQGLSFSIDTNNRLEETNEENNSISGKIFVEGYDLAMDGIDIVPANPRALQNCKIIIKIKNNGTRNLYNSFGLTTYKLDLGDFMVEKFTKNDPNMENYVKPDGTLEYTYEGKYKTPGEKKLYFSIDTINEMEEVILGNNTIEKKITVADPPFIDISLESLTINVGNPVINEEVIITASVKNNSNISLTGDAGLNEDTAKIDFPGFNIVSKSISSMPTTESPFNVGAVLNYSYTGNFYKFGDTSISFAIDSKNNLAETNENNNATTTKFKVYNTKSERDAFAILRKSVKFYGPNAVQISWDTSNQTTGRVDYKEQFVDFDYSAADSSNVTHHEVKLDNLKSNAIYAYRVVVINNTFSSELPYDNFTTPAVDNLSLSSEPKTKTAGNSAAISWSTNLLANANLGYKKKEKGDYAEKGYADFKTDHEIKLENLEDGLYEFIVYATSTSGKGFKSKNYSFLVDKDQPAIQTINNTSIISNNSNSNNISNNNSSVNSETEVLIKNENLYQSTKGKIILKVEDKGKAFYIDPKQKKMYFLGRPKDAFEVMRKQGTGISNANLAKIPVAADTSSGKDSDGDGLSDMLEDALGTDKNKKDSDGDGFDDKSEIKTSFNPSGTGKISTNEKFSNSQKGKIFLQTEGKGEAWYVNPKDGKRYFLGRPEDAFGVMRKLGTGISNNNFNSFN